MAKSVLCQIRSFSEILSVLFFGENGAAGSKKKTEKIKTPKASGEKKGEQIAKKKQPYRVKRRKTIPREKTIFKIPKKNTPRASARLGGTKFPRKKVGKTHQLCHSPRRNPGNAKLLRRHSQIIAARRDFPKKRAE